MSQYIYELEMKVRDYECDLQGIVNNANYQHYLEHTRHEFLTSVGVSFAALHEQGVDTILTCDNGIAAVEQTKLAKSLGMTILITDHHEVQEEVPPADAVVNPRQADCPYPFNH